PVQKEVAKRVVHSMGMPEVAAELRFSAAACEAGLAALVADAPLLCDVEMVKQGVTKRLINHAPLCYLNHPEVASWAKARGETRTMAALSLWQPQLADSVVLIGNAPTALFRLLEQLQQGAERPALIIAMPVGFVGAAESKAALWQLHEALGVECITLLGRLGGSAATVAVVNALLRVAHGDKAG
ncbi:MAG: precorrin-8X methylmutase, partial [Gammaproteobacteria bacterium]|nr:precorrin-8X methylmutase [Gammaproteobacteria bacterium]